MQHVCRMPAVKAARQGAISNDVPAGCGTGVLPLTRIAKTEVGASRRTCFQRNSVDWVRIIALGQNWRWHWSQTGDQHVQDNDRCRRTGSRLIDLSKSGRYDAVAYVKKIGSMCDLVESPREHLSPREGAH